MSDFYPIKDSEAEVRNFRVRIAGAGTGGSVSKAFGAGVQVAYTGVGIVTLTWDAKDDRPGLSLGVDGYAFSAATPANVKGYSMTTGVYNTSARTKVINIFDASNNLVDLKANEFLTFNVAFQAYKK